MPLNIVAADLRRPALSPIAADCLAAELIEIESLDLGQLRVRYRNRTGRIAPARISRSMLLRVLAHRIQVDAFGDLRPETRRMLDRLGAAGEGDAFGSAATSGPPSTVVPRPRPGTLLSREWQGRMERVMVLDAGYAWNGTTYPSLSAAAFAITGTRWNGHRFFGLRDRADAPAPSKGRDAAVGSDGVKARSGRSPRSSLAARPEAPSRTAENGTPAPGPGRSRDGTRTGPRPVARSLRGQPPERPPTVLPPPERPVSGPVP